LNIVDDASYAFFLAAAVQGVFAFHYGTLALLGAALFAIGAFFLRRLRSRVAAGVLLLVSLVEIATAIGSGLGQPWGGNDHLLLPIVMALAATRAVEATFKLRRPFEPEGVDEANVV
jgi:hypothetical protein